MHMEHAGAQGEGERESNAAAGGHFVSSSRRNRCDVARGALARPSAAAAAAAASGSHTYSRSLYIGTQLPYARARLRRWISRLSSFALILDLDFFSIARPPPSKLVLALSAGFADLCVFFELFLLLYERIQFVNILLICITNIMIFNLFILSLILVSLI